MKITVLKDITPIVKSFSGLGISMELSEKRIFSHPIRTIILLISVVIWSEAIIRYTRVYLNDVDTLVFAMTMDVELLLTLAKLFFLIMRRERFLSLNEAMQRLALAGNKCERVLWNKSNSAVLPVSKTYFTMTASTVVLCVLLPIMRLCFYYAKYEKLVYTLPLPGILWYDYTLPWNFAFTLLLTAIMALFFVFTLVSVDCLFSWFVANIAAHLHIMRLKLDNLLQLDNDDPRFHYDFVALITYHTHVIALSSELDSAYAPIIFLVVTCSSLPLCFLFYQFSYLFELANVPFLSLMIGSVVLQLVIYCFGGETVQNECEQLSEAIYMLIPWHNLPPKQRLLYLMPLIRSQRSLTLTGYLFTADRSLLVWIFKTSGSLIAVLLAMKNKE